MNLLKNYLTNIADLGEKEDYKDLHKIYNLNNKIKYSFNMKRILPIHIVTKKIEIINAIGFSFFIFIFTHPKISKKNSGNTLETLINHELIHFKQQVELLFIFHWLLYGFFYIKNRLTKYKSHDEAYMNNPFEREAFSNEDNLDYLKIDCEGGEYDFLMNIDLSNVRYMAIEIHTQLGNDKIKELNNHLLQYFTIINDLNDGINMHKELTLKNKSI